jgi:hypothetical protein
MLFRDPVLWTLGVSAVATLLLLLERRARSRLHALDTWAESHSLRCERDVPVAALSPLEPLALLPEVVAIQRGIQGQLHIMGRQLGTWLLAVLAGNQHRPRSYLLGIFPAPADTPPLRVLPDGDRTAPGNLGYTPMPASALPPGYTAEAFQPLLRSVTDAVGAALREAGPGWRIELRAGRILVSTSAWSAEKPEQLIVLGAQLTAALAAAFALPQEPEPGLLPASGADAPN